MGYNNGINAQGLLGEIEKMIDAASDRYHEAGEEAGEAFVEGVVDGIRSHSKEAKSEITKQFEEFNKLTNKFKNAKSIKSSDWHSVLELSKALLQSDRYAQRVLDTLSDVKATFKGIGEVSGLRNIVKELEKAGSALESVSWSEAGKNFKPRKRTSTKKPKVEAPVVSADPAPVVEGEKKKQKAISKTTEKIQEQAAAQKKLDDAQRGSKARVDIDRAYDAVKYKSIHEDELKEIKQNGEEIASVLTEQRKSLMTQLDSVRDSVSRISKDSSIKDIPFDDLYKDAAKTGERLSIMYDEGITDTEEYIALQYRLINILDRVSDSAGGVKGSGAKSASELRQWIFKSIADETGFDIGKSNAIDAIWGQGTYSIYDSNGKKRNMREIAAERIGYKGTTFTGGFGAEEDYERLTKINAILKFIKDNTQSASQHVTSASKKQTKALQEQEEAAKSAAEAQEKLNNAQKTEVIGYHGTTHGGFTKFDPSKRESGQAVFFSSSRDVAATYADGSVKDVDLSSSDMNQKAVYTGKISANNVVVVDANGSSWRDLQGTTINGEQVESANGGRLRYRLNASQVTPLIIENGVLRGEGPKQTEYGWADTPDGPLGSFIQIGGQKKIELSGTVEKVRQAMIDGGLNEDVADFLLWRSNNDIAANKSAFESGASVSTTPRDFKGVGYNLSTNKLAPFTTDELAEWLFYKGADMVQFDNIRDTGPGVHGNIDDVPLSSVYAVRDAAQIEIIDPSTLETTTAVQEGLESTADAATQSKKSLQDVLDLYSKMSSESSDAEAFGKRHASLLESISGPTPALDYDAAYDKLIEDESKYQQELEETARITMERGKQLQEFVEAAKGMFSGPLSSDEEAVMSDILNKISLEGLSAADAMEELSGALAKLRAQDNEFEVFEGEPQDALGTFMQEFNKLSSMGIDESKLEQVGTRIIEAISNGMSADEAIEELHREFTTELNAKFAQDQKLFNGTGIEDYLSSLNIPDDELDYFKKRIIEVFNLMQSGSEDGERAFKELGEEIFNAGRQIADVENPYKDFLDVYGKGAAKASKNGKYGRIIYNDDYKSEFTDDEWRQITREFGFGKYLVSEKKAKAGDSYIDTLRDDLIELFSGFSEANSEKDLFRMFFDVLRKAKSWKQPEAALPDGQQEEIYDTLARTMSGMSENANKSVSESVDDTVPGLDREKGKLDELGKSADKAAKGKKKVSDANKELGAAADETTGEVGEESEALDVLTATVDKLPEGDVVSKVMIGGNEDPSAAAVKNLRLVNDKVQTEVKRLKANEDGEWDLVSTTVTEKGLKNVQDYVQAYVKEAKKLNDIDLSVKGLGSENIGADFQVKITKYTDAVKELDTALENIQRDPGNPEYVEQFARAAAKAKDARAEVEGVFKESEKLKKIGELRVVGKEDVSKLENLKAAMIGFATSALDGEVKIKGFNKQGTEMYVTLNKGAGAVEEITVALNGATGRLQAFTTGTSKATNEWEEFKGKAVAGAKNLVGMYVGFQEGVQAVRTGVNYVKEIDLAMTELKKVTDETDESYKQFLKDAGSTSAVIGSTIRDFTDATATFARLGYSVEEASSMAETAIVYKNVADGLDTVEESSESIISTMMAFGIEANDTMGIIDRFNAVGNNFAITSAGIGEALQRSASALYAAGNTIDESVALVTAANSVIQNPEQVGRCLPTIK